LPDDWLPANAYAVTFNKIMELRLITFVKEQLDLPTHWFGV
jgi:hypothetical protein